MNKSSFLIAYGAFCKHFSLNERKYRDSAGIPTFSAIWCPGWQGNVKLRFWGTKLKKSWTWQTQSSFQILFPEWNKIQEYLQVYTNFLWIRALEFLTPSFLKFAAFFQGKPSFLRSVKFRMTLWVLKSPKIQTKRISAY